MFEVMHTSIIIIIIIRLCGDVSVQNWGRKYNKRNKVEGQLRAWMSAKGFLLIAIE